MKRILAVLLAVLGILTFCACTSESMKDAQGNTVYREDVVDFSLFIPESWILDSTSFVVSAHAGKDDSSTVMMTQADLTGGYQEIPAIFESTKDELAKIYTYKALTEPEKRTVAGSEAAVYRYSLTEKNDKENKVTLHYLQCLFIKEATLYTFTYYATPELFESHLPEVTKMLDAISFEKVNAPKGMKAAVSAGSRNVDCSDFAIQIPEDWTVDTSTGVFTAMGPAGDVSNLSVMRAKVSEDATAADYYSENKAELTESLKDYTEVALKKDYIVKDTKGGSYHAVMLEYTATVSGQSYRFKQLFCQNGTTMYVVTFSAPKLLFETHTDAFEKAFASFQIVVK